MRGRARGAVRARHAVLWILLVWGIAGLPALFDAPLVKAAQARTWSVARTMVRSGDLVVPRYQGADRLKKPPLASWAQAAAMAATGSTDRRVAGAASWLLGVAFVLAPLLLGLATGRPFAGFLASLLLATCRATVVWGASPEHDVPFAGAIGVAWAATARALASGGTRRAAWTAGLACGAAVLIKGPFAIAFVLGAALVAGGARPARERELPRRVLWTALLVGTLLPALGWLLLLWGRLGGVGPVFDEMTRQALGEAGAHRKAGLGNVFYYVGMIPKWAMPWSVAAIPAVVVLLLRRRRGAAHVPPLPSFAVRAFLVTFAVLTVVPAKQEHYLLPALVPGLLLAACALETACRHRAALARRLPLLLAVLAVAFLGERALALHRAGGAPPAGLAILALAAVAVAGTLATRRADATPRLAVAVLVAAAATTSVATAANARLLARTDDLGRSVEALVRRVAADRPVLGFATGRGEAFDTAGAYLDRDVERLATVDALRARVDGTSGPPPVGATLLVKAPEAPLLAPLAARLRRIGELAPEVAEEKERIVVFRVR